MIKLTRTELEMFNGFTIATLVPWLGHLLDVRINALKWEESLMDTHIKMLGI